MTKKIKWFCLQPLTGGAYLGAEEAIGYKADGVISFQDFAGFSKDKEGNVIAAANEQILVEYLKQKNRLPDWYMLNHAPLLPILISTLDLFALKVWVLLQKMKLLIIRILTLLLLFLFVLDFQ